MIITGSQIDGGYDYTINIGTFRRRPKRDGRNPSTSAFAPNQSTGIVDIEYKIEPLSVEMEVDINANDYELRGESLIEEE